MKERLSKVNLHSFEVIVTYVESNFNFNETAKRFKTNKSNVKKVYSNFMAKLNVEMSEQFEDRQILTDKGRIVYESSKNIIESYKNMLKELEHD